jgi:hypothetical protein
VVSRFSACLLVWGLFLGFMVAAVGGGCPWVVVYSAVAYSCVEECEFFPGCI